MAMQVRIDSAGRIVLPKPVRDKLQLAPGDSLELEQRGDSVTLFPVIEPELVKRFGTGSWRKIVCAHAAALSSVG